MTKNIFKLLILSLFVSGCAGMLNLQPYSAVSPDAVGVDDIKALRTGMYKCVQENPGTESYILFDLIGGNLTPKASKDSLALINSIMTTNSSILEKQWQGYYMALMQVNNVFSIAQNLEDGADKNKTLGECHYFRAYLHMCLVTRFGDVPLMAKNTDEKVFRTPAAEVWQFIADELDEAISLLGAPSEGYNYLSSDAAIALRARVALYMGEKELAAQLAESLIADAKYSLDSFEKIFRGAGNKEIIFAFSCLTPDNSSITISTLFYSYNHPNSGSYVYAPARSTMSMYAESDLRKEMSVTTMDNLNFINKYPSGQTGSDPVVISRLAEMYLISAEAQGLSAGLSRLNDLRSARGLDNIYPSTEDKFISAIMEERRLEFLCEGFRWYDLVRTNKAVSVLGINPYQTLCPIPFSELRTNSNLTQNKGY